MFKINKQDNLTNARTGRIETPHGIVETPAYVIVGTHGEVRTLEPEDLPGTDTQLIIANTYHLWQMLGEEGLNDFLGLHAYMRWSGPLMTDSGGFQVFSLGFLKDQGMRRGGQMGKGKSEERGAKSGGKSEERRVKIEERITDISREFSSLITPPSSPSSVRVTESGVYFSNEAGEEHYLDAETSIKIQEQLGADIIVAFDEPTSPAVDREYTAAAMARTHNWAERSLEAKESKQQIYGVVQGGAFEDLRQKSARFIGALPFDGFAIGSTYGDAYGGTKAQTADMLNWSLPYLPVNKPRHLFGVGRIEDLFAGVELGIDTFDCVIPTREARHGRLWTSQGHIDIAKAVHATDGEPIELGCGCPVCTGQLENKDSWVSKAELRQLFENKDTQAGRLATIHNVFFFNNLMAQIRQAIQTGTFSGFQREYLARLRSAKRE
ncbi:MAG: tRNA guanosine(34) transglycosylase Tgt [Candidatus Liptonbacteria bacterium]|nr:tRNA guanosine(34) transglycosylase Tgt [Candidatus Liptonbacteria bacterium]